MKLKSLAIRLARTVQSWHVALPFRVDILRATGFDIHSTALIRSKVLFQVKELEVGPDVFIGNGCSFYGSVRFPSKVTIGEQTKVAPEVMFCCSIHELGGTERRAGETCNRDIAVGKGCWIGARSTILPGVSIGDGSVIAAGAVVAKDIPANCLAGGVPARVIKKLDER